jgi:hypothetical protein
VSETTSSSVIEALIYGILNAPIRTYPFPHFYAENIFPPDFYDQIRAHFPEPADFTPIEDTGRVQVLQGDKTDRYVIALDRKKVDPLPPLLKLFWQQMSDILKSPRFGEALLAKFHPYIMQRFGDRIAQASFKPDILLIRDRSEYSLGPHSDAARRVVVFLLYLPENDDHPELGTSVYVPKDPTQKFASGPHYQFEAFHRVFTAPYRRNCAFGFVKSDQSFHGVEPLADKSLERTLIHMFLAEED